MVMTRTTVTRMRALATASLNLIHEMLTFWPKGCKKIHVRIVSEAGQRKNSFSD